MKKLKKLITLVATMCMIFSISSIVFAEEAVQLQYRGEAVEVTVAAKTESAYYAYGVGGTILTIEDADAYVIYGEKKYEAVDGVVEVAVTSTSLMYPVEFTIGNAADTEKTFSVDFVYPLGSSSNPEILEDASSIYASIAAGNDQGYFVEFTAPDDGLFGFTVYGAEDAEYNELGWSYTINQVTKTKYGDMMTSADTEVVSSQEFEVSKGDVVQIILSTFDAENPYAVPAGTVSAYVSFEYPVGSAQNPIGIYDVPGEIEVLADSDSFYQGYFAGMTVTLTSDKVSVVYNNKTYTAKDGVITIECPAQGMGRPMPDVFQIINEGTADVAVKVDAKYPEGHMENPKEVVIGNNKVTLEEGSQGYYYVYTAKEDCIFIFDMNSKVWMYNIINMTTYEYGDTHWSDDEEVVNRETLQLSKGDIIRIMVNTYDPDNYVAPSGTIDFTTSIITVDDVNDILGCEKNEEEAVEEFFQTADVKNNADGTEIVVSSITMEDFINVFELAKDVLDDYYMVDIKLKDAQGNVVQPEAGKTVDITLKVPVQIKDAKLIEVFWLDGDKLESLGKCEVKDGKFTFGAKHFSAYVFADVTPASEPESESDSTPTPTPTPTPDNSGNGGTGNEGGAGGQQVKPGDSANLILLFAVAAVAGAVILTRKKTVIE